MVAPETVGFLLIDAGTADYEAIYARQLELVAEKKKNYPSYDYLIMVEHPAVYTYGRRSREAASLVPANAIEVERGGQVTYHNEGQLVCYPILSLRESERDIHKHLRRLELALIDLLAEFGLEGERREGATGVWLLDRAKKIASIGVAVSSWVTFHGCALNVDNDLSGFTRIHPCGFSSEVMTSMKAELGDRCPSVAEVKEAFLRHFSRRFERLLLV